MSITEQKEIRCLCGAPVEIVVYRSANAVRHPALREAIMERRFHAFECQGCRRWFRFDEPFMYVDLDRRQLLGGFSEADRTNWRACCEQVVEAWEAAKSAAPGLEDSLVRACFSHEELREKLIIDDAALDDLVVEVLKSDLLLAEPWLGGSRVETLTLDHLDDDGRLFFWPVWGRPRPEPSGPMPPAVVVERVVYDELATHSTEDLLAKRPGIASGPHVSLLRLALESP